VSASIPSPLWLFRAILFIVLALPSTALASDPEVIEEVLGILEERGLIDDSRRADLVSRNRHWQETEGRSPFAIEWSGDLRMRYEYFNGRKDPLGNDFGNRSRMRYRLRIGGHVDVNPYVAADFRVASGFGLPRSSNKTLGRFGDFDPDGIYIDRVSLTFRPPEGFLGEVLARLELGKQANPFRWKAGPDAMLWDRDMSPEGVVVVADLPFSEQWDFFGRAAWLIADENALSADPYVLGVQAGAIYSPVVDWELALRSSWYGWNDLDNAFRTRATLFGSLPAGWGGGGLDVVEVSAYARYLGIEDWPFLVYGQWFQNVSANSLPGIGKQDTAFAVGAEAGNKSRSVLLGAGYFQAEANVWPAQFVDAPLLDGRTNHKTWAAYAARRVLRATDLKLGLFFGEALDDDPIFGPSLFNSDGVRIQTDVVVQF
jgi:hypothetical protein